MPRIVFISDSHLQHDGPKIPEGDLLIHSGDLTFSGIEKGVSELKKAADWLNEVRISSKFKEVAVIPGNHELGWEKNDGLCRSLFDPAITVLVHQPANLLGVKIFGSPWTPRFYDWEFNADRGPALARLWSQIPDDTEVLFTHGPPKGRLDACKKSGGGGWGDGDDFRWIVEHVGCADLRDRIKDLKALKIHSFGHIHRPGVEKGADGVTYVNAVIVNEKYKGVHKPTVVDYEDGIVKVVTAGGGVL